MAVLIDTGILLRAFVKADSQCALIRSALLQLGRQSEPLVTTLQNMAEFCNVSTRPVAARGGYGLSMKTVEARIAFIERLCGRLAENEQSYQHWKRLISKYDVTGVAVHDTRLVAIMLANGVERVLTVNDRDFRRYEPEGFTVITPQTFADSVS